MLINQIILNIKERTKIKFIKDQKYSQDTFKQPKEAVGH